MHLRNEIISSQLELNYVAHFDTLRLTYLLIMVPSSKEFSIIGSTIPRLLFLLFDEFEFFITAHYIPGR